MWFPENSKYWLMQMFLSIHLPANCLQSHFFVNFVKNDLLIWEKKKRNHFCKPLKLKLQNCLWRFLFDYLFASSRIPKEITKQLASWSRRKWSDQFGKEIKLVIPKNSTIQIWIFNFSTDKDIHKWWSSWNNLIFKFDNLESSMFVLFYI